MSRQPSENHLNNIEHNKRVGQTAAAGVGIGLVTLIIGVIVGSTAIQYAGAFAVASSACYGITTKPTFPQDGNKDNEDNDSPRPK